MKNGAFKICTLLLLGVCYNTPFAQEWQLLGLETERINAIAVDPFDENIIYAGSASDFSAGKRGSLFKSTDGGVTWDVLIAGITVQDIDVHPANSQIVYVTGGSNFLTPAGILKTMNAGKSWVRADRGIGMDAEIGPVEFVMDPQSPDTLYAGTTGFFPGNLYKSTDGGMHWHAIGDTIKRQDDGVTAIAIDPRNSQTLYVGTAGIGSVFKSRDADAIWEKLSLPEVGIVEDVLVHPGDSEIVYVGTWRHGFYFSKNGGISWQSTNTGLLEPVAISKIVLASSKLYIAASDTNRGAVYESHQDTIAWKLVGQRWFNEGVRVVSHSAQRNKLLLGAFGVYALGLSLDVDLHETELSPSGYYLLSYPNPFNNRTNIVYGLAAEAFVTLEVYDLAGRLIKVLIHAYQPVGAYKIPFEGDEVAAGVYLCQLRRGSVLQTKKLLLLR